MLQGNPIPFFSTCIPYIYMQGSNHTFTTFSTCNSLIIHLLHFLLHFLLLFYPYKYPILLHFLLIIYLQFLLHTFSPISITLFNFYTSFQDVFPMDGRITPWNGDKHRRIRKSHSNIHFYYRFLLSFFISVLY